MRMDTLPLDPFELVAIDPARNIRRRWSMIASIDLFGHVLVERRWGRIGTQGRATVHSFPDTAGALRHVRACLARRTSAPRRLGVAYRPRPCPMLAPPPMMISMQTHLVETAEKG